MIVQLLLLPHMAPYILSSVAALVIRVDCKGMLPHGNESSEGFYAWIEKFV